MQEKILIALLLCSFLVLIPCSFVQAEGEITAAAAEKEFLFTDDGTRQSLNEAAKRSLAYYARQAAGVRYKLGNHTVTKEALVRSIKEFTRIMAKKLDTKERIRLIQNRFDIFEVKEVPGKAELLVTGYYEPEFQGRLIRQGKYQHPLYQTPPDLLQLTSPAGERKTRRLDHGRILPSWSREEIDASPEPLRGSELVYLADPLEVFILHVQGSGKIRFADGSIRRIGYDADNGKPYTSIGKRLVELGKLTLEQATMPGIVSYLQSHPHERDMILHTNTRYIFFRWLDATGFRVQGPLGSMGEGLIPGRSLALDPECYPLGGLAFLETEKPVAGSGGMVTAWEPMTRFVFHHDTGGAIKGPGRADVFWGSGPYADFAAGVMRQQGKLYFLVEKGGLTAAKSSD